MKMRSLFSPLAVVALLVVGGLLAALVTVLGHTPTVAAGTTPTPEPRADVQADVQADPVARTTDPQRDYPRMPSTCVPSQEKIPTKAVLCQLTTFDADRPSILLWGDSHAWMFIPALVEAADGRDVNLLAVMMGSCPPMDNAVKPNAAVPGCYRSNAVGVRAARDLAASGQPYKIILASSWERYLQARETKDRSTYLGRMAEAMRDGTPRLVRTLTALGADVDVVGQVATVPTRHAACAAGDEPFACSLPRAAALPEEAATTRYVAATLEPLLGSRPTIDVTPYFCSATDCNGTVGQTLTWFDDLHLSASMATELASYFAPSVDAVAPACRVTIPIICP